MAKRIVPGASYAREVLDYNPLTGLFKWKSRQIYRGRFTHIRNNFPTVGALSKKDGYIRIQFGGRPELAHRIAWLWMTGEWPKQDIDHINRKRADNRWHNLRELSRSKNCRNRKYNQRAGVHFDKEIKKWRVYIWREKIGHIHIGIYHSEALALKISHLLHMNDD